jgi:outer membrane receptor protein involved in Fe transport
LAQVPHHQASAQITWTPRETISVSASLRGTSSQFDDDQNTRILKGYVVADTSAEFAVTESASLTLAIENVLNKTIQSGRSADGLISVGTPRTARMGLRVAF